MDKTDKTFDDNEFLWSQFIRLGKMLGDEDCVNCGAKFTLGKRRR